MSNWEAGATAGKVLAAQPERVAAKQLAAQRASADELLHEVLGRKFRRVFGASGPGATPAPSAPPNGDAAVVDIDEELAWQLARRDCELSSGGAGELMVDSDLPVESGDDEERPFGAPDSDDEDRIYDDRGWDDGWICSEPWPVPRFWNARGSSWLAASVQ